MNIEENKLIVATALYKSIEQVLKLSLENDKKKWAILFDFKTGNVLISYTYVLELSGSPPFEWNKTVICFIHNGKIEQTLATIPAPYLTDKACTFNLYLHELVDDYCNQLLIS
jgi:hypothetical protein